MRIKNHNANDILCGFEDDKPYIDVSVEMEYDEMKQYLDNNHSFARIANRKSFSTCFFSNEMTFAPIVRLFDNCTMLYFRIFRVNPAGGILGMGESTNLIPLDNDTIKAIKADIAMTYPSLDIREILASNDLSTMRQAVANLNKNKEQTVKHVQANQLKTCIFIEGSKFEQTVKAILGDNISVTYDYDGITFHDNDNDDDELDTAYIYSKLSEYYGINISSIHIDDCDIVGVWICYKI